MEVTNNSEKNRFELEIDNQLAIIVYEIRPDKIYLISTEVPSELSGKGVGNKLVTETMKEIENMGLKVVPVCSFIQKWFTRHPEKKHLLS